MSESSIHFHLFHSLSPVVTEKKEREKERERVRNKKEREGERKNKRGGNVTGFQLDTIDIEMRCCIIFLGHSLMTSSPGLSPSLSLSLSCERIEERKRERGRKKERKFDESGTLN